jgi:S-DNA-T family DNA segregation ATPase FtsK/SpoIIIE
VPSRARTTVVCGQRFGAELGKGATMLRAGLTGRVCHRVDDEAPARTALGDISPEAVLTVCAIAAGRPGLARTTSTRANRRRL